MFAADVADDDELPAFTVDFSGDGKLGYGFTSADDLEEVDIGPADNRDRHLSAESWIRSCVSR